MNENRHTGILIGVSSGWLDEAHRTVPAYVQSIIDAGATPVIIPVTDNEVVLNEILSRIDGLLLTGGGDIHPKYWGEELRPESNTPSEMRDKFDLYLVRRARQICMPVLGICRGMQAINVEFGGSIYQDIYSQIGAPLLPHAQTEPRDVTTHAVETAPGSILSEIMGSRHVEVNSFHHQAVKNIGRNLRATAFSDDSIAEAIELPYYNMIGVQWHPENLYKTRPEEQALFDWLIDKADIYRRARTLHRTHPVIDTHTDTPMVWTDATDLGERQNPDEIKVDFVKMADGGISGVFMVAYLPQEPLDAPDYQEKARAAHNTAVEIIERLGAQALKHNDKITLDNHHRPFSFDGRPHAFFGVENGFALAGDIANVEKFYRMGVRYITLCHNGDNDLCDSAKGVGTHGGLSDFGRRVVCEMNRLGMIIDLSHAADSTIEQVIELSSIPPIATHTSARALCHHPRNMSDELIRSLIARGGMINICLYNHFLDDNGRADLYTICDHIDHIVHLTGSTAGIGIGSDFDGGGGVPGCSDESELIMITQELLARGYADTDVARIMGDNFVQYLNTYICK